MSHKQEPLFPIADGNQGLQGIIFRSVSRLQRFANDVSGIFFLAFSIITLLGLLGFSKGTLLTPWIDFLRHWMGYGSGIIVLMLGWFGLLMVRRRLQSLPEVSWSRVLALEVAAFAILTLLAIIEDVSLERAELGKDGGIIGWGLAEFLGLAIGPFWRAVLSLAIILFGGLWGFGFLTHVLGFLQRMLEGEDISKNILQDSSTTLQVIPVGEEKSNTSRPRDSDAFQSVRKKADLPSQFRKKFKMPSEKKNSLSQPPRNDELPPLNLLIDGRTLRPNERNINMTAGLIEKTLAEFGIPAKVTGFQVGPTVTQFAVEPGFIEKPGSEGDVARFKVRVSQIASLSKDLALALSANRLRIEAPVPGRAYVGIEIPNTDAVIVRLRSILESEAFYSLNSPLAIGLGLDVSGAPVVADLARMPHLLIAGTTGSGKSVCISAITTCLAINNTPRDLRLVMIDPKKVELVRFNGLPHLLGNVETDLDRIMGVLRWVVAEMDHRYRLLEQYRARNIDSFNKKMSRRKKPPESLMPRIVVLIDELADLMMSAAEQTEPALVRLAQLARATGIHLVMATQRPSTDVVTGLIKANFPARLAFAVASSIDSRVILDMQGAESLLGNGDMLFLSPEAGSPVRAQGAVVTDQELERLIMFWQEKHKEKDEAAPWNEIIAQEAILAERDDLVEQAIEIVRSSQRASASMLQRRLRIGYPRAARLIDELEDLGIIGPSMGGGRERDVLIDPDDEIS